jgi:hypothetical protein
MQVGPGTAGGREVDFRDQVRRLRCVAVKRARDIMLFSIEQPQWQQLDDFINRIIKRFFPLPESLQMLAAPDPSARSVGLV